MVTAETPKIFARKMAMIAQMYDNGEDQARRFIDEEEAHRMADKLMCDILIELGYGEGVDIFKKIPKWYA